MAHRGCNAAIAALQLQLAEAHLALRVYANSEHWGKDSWNVLAIFNGPNAAFYGQPTAPAQYALSDVPEPVEEGSGGEGE